MSINRCLLTWGQYTALTLYWQQNTLDPQGYTYYNLPGPPAQIQKHLWAEMSDSDYTEVGRKVVILKNCI